MIFRSRLIGSSTLYRVILISGVFLLFSIVALFIRDEVQTNVDPKVTISHERSCITGVAMTREETVAASEEEIRESYYEIKETLGISIIWQLYDPNISLSKWREHIQIAKEYDVKLIAAFTTADHKPTCNDSTCELGPERVILEEIGKDPEFYSSTIYGVLLIDEPLEDGLTSEQLKSLYKSAKKLADVPMVVGWSRQLWKIEDSNKRPLQFDDGMCDICLISGLESRDYGKGHILDIETLISNHEVSRRVINSNDSDAMIISSIQAFGNIGGTNYVMPSLEELTSLTDTVLNNEGLNKIRPVDGVMFQSWKAPTDRKAASQVNLSDDGYEEHRAFVNQTCKDL